MLRRKRSRYARSQKLFAAASRILPGGVDSPVRAFKAVGGTPVFVARAQGRTPRGRRRQHLRRLRDVLGSAHPRARAEGLAEGAGSRPPHAARALAPHRTRNAAGRARAQCSCPRWSAIRFVSSGTEAAMSAVRVARAATGCDRIVKFEGCYHGHADAFLVQAGSGAMTLGVPTSPGVSVGRGARHAPRPLQRPGIGRGDCSRRTPSRSRRSSSSRLPATWASCRQSRIPRGPARALRSRARAAGLRRGDFGIPRRDRWRAAGRQESGRI